MSIDDKTSNSRVVSIMVDIETLGLDTRTCPVVQVAGLVFNLRCPEDLRSSHYNAYASAVSNADNSRFPSKETMEWWETKKDRDIFDKVFNTPGQNDIEDVLKGFADWVNNIRLKALSRAVDFNIWSKPAKFDLEILRYYMEDLGIPVPWNRREERDGYTILGLMPEVLNIIPICNTKAHDALYDCQYQAATLEYIQDALKVNLG